MTNDRETVVVSSGNNGAAWFIAGIVALALVIGGYMLATGAFDRTDSVQVELKVPEALAPGN